MRVVYNQQTTGYDWWGYSFNSPHATYIVAHGSDYRFDYPEIQAEWLWAKGLVLKVI